MKNNILWAILLIGVLVFVSQQPAPTTIDDTDYSSLVDAGVSFTGRNLHVPGTALSSEDVRVIRLNGGDERKDLGYFSLDSTSMDVTPNVDYKFYYFMNTSPSGLYYVDVEDYTGLVQDAVDNVFGEGCTIDTNPTFWVLDENGATQTASANAQSLGASETRDVTINIKARSDKCYGMPDAFEENKQNSVCFIYDGDIISSVDANTGRTIKPKSIRDSGNATSKTMDCYKFPIIQDTEVISLGVTITASSSEPTSAHNITVMSEDICVDLNADTLGEIWGYEDEDYTNLCAPEIDLGRIYIS